MLFLVLTHALSGNRSGYMEYLMPVKMFSFQQPLR